jgi:hypothetical protein
VDVPDSTPCVLVSQPHPFGNNNAICYVLLIMFVYKRFVDTLCLRRPKHFENSRSNRTLSYKSHDLGIL